MYWKRSFHVAIQNLLVYTELWITAGQQIANYQSIVWQLQWSMQWYPSPDPLKGCGLQALCYRNQLRHSLHINTYMPVLYFAWPKLKCFCNPWLILLLPQQKFAPEQEAENLLVFLQQKTVEKKSRVRKPKKHPLRLQQAHPRCWSV